MITLRFTKIGFTLSLEKTLLINSQEQFKLTAPFIRFIFKLPVDRKEERGRRKILTHLQPLFQLQKVEVFFTVS